MKVLVVRFKNEGLYYLTDLTLEEIEQKYDEIAEYGHFEFDEEDIERMPML